MIKSRTLTRALAIAVLACVLVTGGARALRAEKVNMFLGAKIATVTWRPYLVDVGRKYVPPLGWQYLHLGSGIMYGASLSLLFIDKINLSVSYLYGDFQTYLDKSYYSYNFTKDIIKFNHYMYNCIGKGAIKRHDIDSALSVDITHGFKIFAGFKYQPLKMNIDQNGAKWRIRDFQLHNSGGYFRIDMKYTQENFAPGLGIGYSVPFAEIFSFNINASGIYYRSSCKLDHRLRFFGVENSDWILPDFEYSKLELLLTGYGVNADTSFMAYMKNRIIMVLGFRCQYALIEGKLRDSNPFYYKYIYYGNNTTGKSYELVFGAYVSVMVRVI